MGAETLAPYLEYGDKLVIVLAVTSNDGANDFQGARLQPDGNPLYSKVMSLTSSHGSPENMMFVVGATRPDLLTSIRKEYPEHLFLVPGVGAQGGNIGEVLTAAGPRTLINMSRSIIYAIYRHKDYERWRPHRFELAARKEAEKAQAEMKAYLD